MKIMPVTHPPARPIAGCRSAIAVVVCLAASAIVGGAHASIVGFTEGFDDGPANWRNFNGSADLDWFAAGGPSDSAYASGLRNLSNLSAGGFPATVIRAQLDYNSSGGLFAGNWIEAGVIGVSFDFRHNLAEAIQVTARFATPNNNPGASAETSFFVAPNQWTSIYFDLTPDSTDIISFGSGNYQSIFSNIGNIQIGFNVPMSLAGQNFDGRFDIDNFTIIPAPGAIFALAGLGLAGTGRRRRDR